MKKWLLLLPFLFLPFMGRGQVVGPGFVDYVTSAPSGSCSQNAHQRNVMGTGDLYTCQSGTWGKAGGSGGGGCAQGTCVVNAPTSDQTISGAHALILSDAGSSLIASGTARIGPDPSTLPWALNPSATLSINNSQNYAVNTIDQFDLNFLGTNLDSFFSNGEWFGFNVNTVGSAAANSSALIGGSVFIGSDLTGDTHNFSGIHAADFYVYHNGSGNAGDVQTIHVGGVAVTGGGAINNQYIIEGQFANATAATGNNAIFHATTAGNAANSYAILVDGGQSNLGPGATTVGSLVIPGSGSGTATIVAPAAAGSPTLTLPTGTGTIPSSATSPITLNPAGTIACGTCATGLGAPNPGTSGGLPYYSSTTALSSSALLTSNSPVLGGGAGSAPKTSTFLTTDGAAVLTTGVIGGGNGSDCLAGNTSGTACFTAPAVAGTRTNQVTMTNALTGPAGAAGTPTYGLASGAGMYGDGAGSILFSTGSTYGETFTVGNGHIQAQYVSNATLGWGAGTASPLTVDTAFSRASAGVVQVGTSSSSPNASGSMNATNFTATGAVSGATYATATNCSNAASPAVCAAAASGVVAVPTGTNPTLTVNTTAVTANSRIFLQIDESATIAATTCNTTLSTLVQPVVTARVAATSFTIQIGAVIATNPACVSYLVFN